MSSPTQRTMERLRRDGWLVAVVERFNVHAVPPGAPRCSGCQRPIGPGVRQDLWGFIDLLAVRADQPGVLGVQVTSSSNIVSRIVKITDSETLLPRLRVWLEAGNGFEVHGWDLRGAAGKRKTYSLDRRIFRVRDDGTIGVRREDGASLPAFAGAPREAATPRTPHGEGHGIAPPVEIASTGNVANGTIPALRVRDDADPFFADVPLRQRVLG